MLENIIKIAILSAPTKKIITHTGLRIRSQLNVLLLAPYGSGKTTLTTAIEGEGLGVRITRYTMASMLGTITKSGDIKEPAVVKGAGRLIMIDEFQNIPAMLRDELLTLMEEQLAERELAFMVSQPVYKQGKYYEIIAEDGSLKTRVRASYMITTMHLNLNRPQDIALLSRTFPISLGFNLDDAEALIKGEIMYDFSDVKDSLYLFDNKEMKINEDNAMKIFEMLRGLAEKYKIEAGHVMRMWGDMVRIANVLSILKGYDEIKYSPALKTYAKIYVQGIRGAELGVREFKVLDYIEKHRTVTTDELEREFNFSKSQLNGILRMLQDKGFIEWLKFGVWKVKEE